MFVQGGTDSEWAFALSLDSMDRMGDNPSQEQGKEGYGHTVLRKAILETIKRINQLIAEIPEDSREEDTRSLLNFAVTDGHSVVCTRYVSSKMDEAASLFFSSGTNWREYGKGKDGRNDYKMERRDKGADIVLVASEPLTFERGTFNHISLRQLCFSSLTNLSDNWVTVPTNSTLTIHKQTVMIHPIIDEFYNENPSHTRSSQFAQTKGQTITNSKKEVILGAASGDISGSSTPANTTGDHELDALRGSLASLKAR